MAGGKESPRQKMIGMMYLVLTALLAMNVSKEILNSFIIVNNGLLKTNQNFDVKNSVTYNAFEMAKLNDEVKVKKFYDRAQTAKKLSEELDKEIKQIKRELLFALQQIPPEVADTFNLAKLDSKDNVDIPTHYMMGEGIELAAEHGKAKELKEKIRTYKQLMLTLVDERQRSSVKIGLNIDSTYSSFEEKWISWDNNNFYHNPAAAVFTILTKMQNDIKNAEGDVINTLYTSISAADFKFDKLEAKIIPNSNYILIGEEYKADVFVAAYNSTQFPQIVLGDVDTSKNEVTKVTDSITVFENGMGKYVKRPTSEGEVKWSGIIKVKNPSNPNDIKKFPFNSSYRVARPAIVVSPDKMNVFYIGPENPVSISVPGIPAENLQPSMSGGGTITGAKGKYIVRVTTPGEVTVNVSAKTEGGTKSMGPGVKFRVKRVPPPTAFVAGKKGDDKISKSELMSIQGVSAKLENFDFDLNFVVTSFDLSMNVKGTPVTETSSNNKITSNQANYLKMANTGAKVYFENVKAKGPDGLSIPIPGVNLRVK